MLGCNSVARTIASKPARAKAYTTAYTSTWHGHIPAPAATPVLGTLVLAMLAVPVFVLMFFVLAAAAVTATAMGPAAFALVLAGPTHTGAPSLLLLLFITAACTVAALLTWSGATVLLVSTHSDLQPAIDVGIGGLPADPLLIVSGRRPAQKIPSWHGAAKPTSPCQNSIHYHYQDSCKLM
jgi:hypothetical protein